MNTFTQIHVAISLAGILSGFVVAFGLITGRRLDRWTAFFVLTTIATSVTGFFFPFQGFTPAIVVGIISLIVLAATIFARYARHLAGAWRLIYVLTAMIALYLNVFVLIVQLFRRVPTLKALAPTQSESPFVVTQLMALTLFVVLTIIASRRFRIMPVTTATAAGRMRT